MEQLEVEVQRALNRPIAEDFRLEEASVKATLNRDSPEESSQLRSKLKGLSREALTLADRIS